MNLQGQPRSGPSIYRPELDVLRFFAFLAIFIHHVLPRGDDAYRSLGSPALMRIASAVQNMFGFGLSLFFMLSAFLITDLLVREKEQTGDVHIGQFYLRRILRIWPLYFLGIFIGIFHAVTNGAPDELTLFLMCALMVGNWFFVSRDWPDNPETPLWSISIEEQFYLLWPSVVKWLDRAQIYAVCGGLVVLAMAVEYVLGERHASVDTTVWTNTFVQFETFAVGAALALLLKGSSLPLPRATRPVIAVLGLGLWFAAVYWFEAKAVMPASSGLSLIVGLALSIAGNLALMVAALGLRIAPTNVFVYLGKISFGLYVFHLLFIGLAERAAPLLSQALHMDVPKQLLGLLSMFPTILYAALSYRYFETPFLRLKERFTFVKARPI